jgi:hypothetical protein
VHFLFPRLHLIGVINRGEGCFDPHLMAEILEDVAIELLNIVDRYLSWYPETTYYVPQKNLLSLAASMLTRGFASIYFVKYSTATIVKVP